ncbi:MAG: hypothetical protein PVSMB1_08780 [Gemmatimonadaceae bacterium]
MPLAHRAMRQINTADTRTVPPDRSMKAASLFLIILFGVTWTLGFLWRSPGAPHSLWEVLATLLPTVWAPTIIALILTGSMEGPAGVRKEIKARLSYRRGSARWLVLATILPILAMLIAVYSARAAGDGASFISPADILTMIGLQVVTGAVGEELGWRGFLLPRLTKRFSETAAAWVMAILWSFWHVPAWFNPALPHRTMPLISTLLFIALFGFFLAFVFNRTGESVLATILAHLSLNIMTGVGGVRLSSVVFWRTLAGVFGAFALLITYHVRVSYPATVYAAPGTREIRS